MRLIILFLTLSLAGYSQGLKKVGAPDFYWIYDSLNAFKDSANIDVLRVGGNVNYATIDSVNGITYFGNTTTWDDLRFPTTQTKQGSNSLPHFDYTNIGLLFPDNDTTEKIYIIAQFPHTKKIGTDVEIHVHYIQTSADSAIFGMQYRWYDIGEAVPGYSQILTNNNIINYTSGSIHNKAEFMDVPGSDSGVSSIMDIIIWRRTVDNIVGDVLVKEVDIHYQIGNLGSAEEY